MTMSEGTVTLSIINEALRDNELNIHKENLFKCNNCGTINNINIELDNYINFTCFLSFLSKSDDTYLPPFLPAFNFSINKNYYNGIIEHTQNLGELIIHNYNVNNKIIIDEIENIGSRIFTVDRRFQEALEKIAEESYENIVIFTNDPHIPWQWVYIINEKKFLIDIFPCGTIYTERIDDSRENFFRKKNWSFKRQHVDENYFENKKVILLWGESGEKSNIEKLTHCQDEIINIGNTFEKYFSAGNIFHIPSINDQDENIDIIKNNMGDQVSALTSRKSIRKDLKIIHFAGHIGTKKTYENDIQVEQTMLCLGNRDEDFILSSDFQGEKYESEPLIFLNGCYSGKIFDVWSKSADLATTLLSKNASGCIASISMIEDESSSLVSKLFYEILFENPEEINYGEALFKVRQKIKKENPYDPVRLLFLLFGDPNAKLVYTKAKNELLLDIMSSIE